MSRARTYVRALVWASFAASASAVSCAGPQPPSTPVAEVIDVPFAWSYCDTGDRVNLSRENADVIESDALRMRTRSPYDVIVVPGYTPDDAKRPMPEVHPVAASRLDEAIALYKEGKASLVLVTGGAVRPEGTPYTEALVMKRYLLERGISEAAIVVEPCARHSTTNLRNAGRFMLKYHLRTALVVTSADQAFYFANGRVSSFELRSRTELGYMVGSLKNRTSTSIEFAPSAAVLRRGPDPRDP